MRRWTIAWLCLLASCQQSQCQSTSAESVVLSSTHFVPQTAAAVVQTDRLQDVLEFADELVVRWPSDSALGNARAQWQRVLGLDPLSAKAWTTLGVDIAGPATFFVDDGYWILHARMVAPETFQAWVDARKTAKTFVVETATIEGWKMTELTLPDGTPIFAVARNAGDTLFMPGARLQPTVQKDVARREALHRLITMQDAARLDRASWVRGFQREYGNAHIAGMFQPSLWMDESYGTGQAGVIYQRLRNQLGPVGFVAHYMRESSSFELDLLSQADPLEPTFVRDVKGAAGPLPVVGGLVEPGVLGVVRLSVQPRKFYDLVRSLLPPAARLEVDAWVQDLDDALAIDLVGDVMTNLMGHIVIAIYGFEPEVLKVGNPSFAFDLLTLAATREAVLMPIRDHKRMERVLDAWTQASQGKLNRQRDGESVQYAWFDDGSLSWAILLGRDHIVLVDSTAAFDHAIAFERSARPLDAMLVEKGLPVLFEGMDRSGLYLDTTSFSNLLGEAKNETLSAYMRPFKSVVLTSDMGKKINRIHVRALFARSEH